MQLIIVNKNIDEHQAHFPWSEVKKISLLVLKLFQLPASYWEKAGRETSVLPPTLESYARINGSLKAEILGVKFIQLPSTWSSGNGKAY